LIASVVAARCYGICWLLTSVVLRIAKCNESISLITISMIVSEIIKFPEPEDLLYRKQQASKNEGFQFNGNLFLKSLNYDFLWFL